MRRQCAQHAATPRRALVDRVALGLVASTEPVFRAGRDRGVLAEVQVIGNPGLPGEDVVRATVGADDLVLGVIPPQPAMLTILASGDAAEMYLTFERLPLFIRWPRLGRGG